MGSLLSTHLPASKELSFSTWEMGWCRLAAKIPVVPGEGSLSGEGPSASYHLQQGERG